MIDTLIVDDQEIVREGLKMILSLHDEINLVGEAENGVKLIEMLKSITPEVVLMDIRMPLMDGIEATRIVKEQYPNIKVIILTTFQEDEYIFKGLKYGADGYVFKDSGSDAILQSIHAACSGNILLNPFVSQKLIGALNPMGQSVPGINTGTGGLLTSREVEVCEQVLLGKSNKEIGSALFVTEGTVKNYISHILDKLDLKSRAELLVFLQKTQ
ncbi:MAG: response regulator transcription factor [Bacillota bacterium]|nr:response regulator transcription factor [Bacillota bacterium]